MRAGEAVKRLERIRRTAPSNMTRILESAIGELNRLRADDILPKKFGVRFEALKIQAPTVVLGSIDNFIQDLRYTPAEKVTLGLTITNDDHIADQPVPSGQLPYPREEY